MKNEINLYFHCKKCSEENNPRRMSMQDYQKLEIGWTKKGFQVWCVRHDCNVANFDLKGQQIDLLQGAL